MKPDFRNIAIRALELSGINFLAHKVNAGKLAVLCYHGVVAERMSREDPNFETTVSADDLAQHLELILKWFHPVTLSEVRAHCLEDKPLPSHPALVTFDDGYRNVYTHAAPVLRRYGVPAALFVCTSYIGTKSLFWYDEIRLRLNYWQESQIAMPLDGAFANWPKDETARLIMGRDIQQACKRVSNHRRLEYMEYIRAHTPTELPLTDQQHHVLDPMDWDEVRSLLSQGVEIGSQAMTHPILSKLSPDELKRELSDSKAEIERQTGRAAFSIAYPNGTQQDYSRAVLEATRNAGYDLAFTLVEQLNDRRNGPYLISRLGIPGHVPLTALRVRVSGLHPLLTGTGSRPVAPTT